MGCSLIRMWCSVTSAEVAQPYFPLPECSLFCKVIPGFLSAQECLDLIHDSEARGFTRANSDYPPSYRNNDRQVLDSPELAAHMWARLQGLIPLTMQMSIGDQSSLPGRLDSINERFRFCRYRPGQQFEIHQDGVYHRSRSQQSCLTFLVYLTDGESFEGGDTLFYLDGPRGDASQTVKVTPRAGSLIVFDHRLWHSGARVDAGVKYILRSDILYRVEEGACDQPAATFETGHQGYVWTLEGLDDVTFASGGRDTSILVWHRDGRLLRELNGHARSVLGLASWSGGRLASVSRDRSLRIWDWATGLCLSTVEQAHAAAVLSVVRLNENQIATSGADQLIKVWSTEGNFVQELTGHQDWVWALDKMPDGRLASASEDGDVRIWDVSRGACVHVLPGGVPLRSLAVSADGQGIATVNLLGGLVIWAWRDGAWVRQQDHQAHSAAVRRVRWLSRSLLATTGEDNQTCLWVMPEGKRVHAERSENFTTDVLAMGGDILSCSYDGRIRRLADITPRQLGQGLRLRQSHHQN